METQNDDDDMPEHLEWGASAPPVGAVDSAGKRRDDLRIVALAYRYASAFTTDYILSTEIAANALQRLYPELSRSEVRQQAVNLVAYATRAHTTSLNKLARQNIRLTAPLRIELFVWSEHLRLKYMGVEYPGDN